MAKRNPETPTLWSPAPAALPVGAIAAAMCGLAAAWVAAGDVGLVGHALRHALTLVLMTASVAACWPERRTRTAVLVLLATAAAAVLMTASSLAPVNVLAVAVLLAGLAAVQSGAAARTMLLVSQAAAVFGIYRVAVTAVPIMWVAADTLGGWLGIAGGAVAGQPLSVGASFAGVDVLVLMAALCGLWLAATPAPRRVRAIAAACGILGAHLVYLVVLSYASQLAAAIPPAPALDAAVAMSPDKPWLFWPAVATLVPWNLPALAVLLQMPVIAAMLRWAAPPVAWPDESTGGRRSTVRAAALAAAALAAAVVLPAATSLYPAPAGLAGRKIVAYEKGFLNWLRPEHGQYGRLSIGMYGMLPDFVESLGGTFVKSPDLSAEDLKGADALILIYPNEPWKPGQLDRIWDFVRGGGGLLVMGEHTVRESDGGARFNDVLEPTAMRVPFDTAEWAVGGWLDSYETLAHPITAGARPERNDLGVVIGASVEARPPARPLILGRWGWCDPGDPGSPRAMMGNGKYDGGDRLGDVCLAAEQRLGTGKVIVFGDTSPLSNGINISSHVFLSGLLSYLASPQSAQSTWRQWAGLLAAAAACVLLLVRPRPWQVAAVALAAASSLAVCSGITNRANVILPDGRGKTPNNVAYIDASHLGAFSPESLRDDGLMGLELTLMRSGLLTFGLSDFSAAALEVAEDAEGSKGAHLRAGLLISIAPTREFSAAERRAVREFVDRGGIFILTAGYDGSRAAAPLMADFGFRFGEQNDPAAEPLPMGHFKARYLNIDGNLHYVRFDAAWPLADAWAGRPGAPPAQPFAYGPGDRPVILMRQVGKGRAVVVGDTGFAMNKNLEHMDGSPFEGMRENADFWRWFLAYLRGQPAWLPSPVPAEPPPPEAAAPAPEVKP